MKVVHLFLGALCVILFSSNANAQTKYTSLRVLSVDVQNVDSVPPAYMLLASSNNYLRSNSFQNELLIDQVVPYEVDTQLTIRKQWHRVGPLVIPLLMGGYNWRAVFMTKQKFVGTGTGHWGMSHKDHLTEYDITFNLRPHLQLYTDKLCESTRKQIKTIKGRHAKERWAAKGYSCDSMPRHEVHCELTPHKDFRHHMNQSFMPTVRPHNLKGHVNFGEAKPTMGVYGVMCLDCNHSCHTEIHPAEWIWWLDVNPEKTDSVSKRWVAGLFHEASNRFKKWSKAPRIGTIAIPFLFKADNLKKQLFLQPISMGTFQPEGLQKLNLPAITNDWNFSEAQVQVGGQVITIYNSQPLYTTGTVWWLENVKTNGEWIWGYFKMAVSNRKIFTFKLEQSAAAQ